MTDGVKTQLFYRSNILSLQQLNKLYLTDNSKHTSARIVYRFAQLSYKQLGWVQLPV